MAVRAFAVLREDLVVAVSLTRPMGGLPPWPQRIRLLRRGALVLAGLAVLVDAYLAVVARASAEAYLALLVSACAVVLSPGRPARSLVVAVGGVCVAVAVGWDPATLWSVAVFLTFSATLAGVAAFRSGLLVAAALYLVIGWSDAYGFTSAGAAAAVSTTVAAAGVGGGLRAQARYWKALEQRAADSAAQAVAAERLRIARDLHDLVGHEVAVLNMHLGVAEVSLPPGATRAASALVEARTAVQSVLAETQQILTLLRNGDTRASLDDPGQPTPGVDQVSGLVDAARQRGLRVDGDLRALDGWFGDPAAGVTLYRVVQEALTNASRYSDGAARLTSERDGDTLSVTVSNRSSRQQPPSEHRGYGLLGMRERLAAIGGALEVTDDAGTFQLTATLPAHDRSRR